MARTNAALLQVEGLSVFYGDFKAVDGVDLSVDAGEIVSIIGANGAGKSTLLKAIIGQSNRVEGRVRFDGTDLAGRSTAEIVAGGVALVPEGRRLFASLSVEENLRLGWAVGRKGAIGFDEVWRLAGRRADAPERLLCGSSPLANWLGQFQPVRRDAPGQRPCSVARGVCLRGVSRQVRPGLG
jgi:ABC-type sugar transport system ATPase subunit